jgi:hypothetical protein
MKWMVFTLTYIVALSNAFTQEKQPKTEFKLTEMSQFLEKLKLSPILPERSYNEFEAPRSSKRPLSADVKEIFDKVEQAVFGRQGLITLKACADCKFEAYYMEKALYVQHSIVDDLRKKYGAEFPQLMLFILAHEIAHFISESSLDKNGRSINGFETLQKNTPLDPDASAEVIKRIMSPIALAHAEVDVFALLVLKSMGAEMPTVALRMLEGFVSEASAIEDKSERAFSVVEMDTRFRVMQEYLKVVWAQ